MISIENVDIDVNLTAEGNWKEDLAERILSQFKEKIYTNISGRVAGVTTGFLDRYLQVLVYFLQYGILPWYSTISSKKELQAGLSKWINSSSPAAIKDLAIAIKDLTIELRDDNSVWRFVKLLGRNDVELFLTPIMDNTGENFHHIFRDVKRLATYIGQEQTQQENLINGFIKMLILSVEAGSSAALTTMAIKKWLHDIPVKYYERLRNIDPAMLQTLVMKKITVEVITTRVSSLVDEDDSTEKIQDATVRHEAKQPAGKGNAGIVDDVQGIGSQKEFTGGVFVSNGGAVIIAPFLPTLFSRTGLLHENKITDIETALSLVHYCITGNTDPAEFELLLPKIFCGIDPATVAGGEWLKDEKLLKEADEMLASVIEYWQVLKDTSPAVLRAEFLQRNGKLSFVKDEWWLQVEQKPYDIVLEQLPWDITRIKLPWMKYFLKTDWI